MPKSRRYMHGRKRRKSSCGHKSSFKQLETSSNPFKQTTNLDRAANIYSGIEKTAKVAKYSGYSNLIPSWMRPIVSRAGGVASLVFSPTETGDSSLSGNFNREQEKRLNETDEKYSYNVQGGDVVKGKYSKLYGQQPDVAVPKKVYLSLYKPDPNWEGNYLDENYGLIKKTEEELNKELAELKAKESERLMQLIRNRSRNIKQRKGR